MNRRYRACRRDRPRRDSIVEPTAGTGIVGGAGRVFGFDAPAANGVRHFAPMITDGDGTSGLCLDTDTAREHCRRVRMNRDRLLRHRGADSPGDKRQMDDAD
jgi:hypothetical protein